SRPILGTALILGFAALSPTAGFAAIAACSGTGTGNALSTYAAGLGNGCGAVDLSFENISLSSPVATGGGVAETTANNAIVVTGTTPQAGVTAQFDPTVAGNWSLNGPGNESTGATINYAALTHS